MNSRTILVIAVLVALLGGGWVYLSHSSNTHQPAEKEFSIKVEGKSVVSGPEILSVHEGDTVTIKITGDVEEELHLHGYDKSVDLSPGQEASLTFMANISGRFPYELERSGTEIGALEVQP